MSKAVAIINRDIEFYIASREFEEYAMRRCEPADEPNQRCAVLAARAVVTALACYRNALVALERLEA